MSRKDDRAVIGALGQLFHENRAHSSRRFTTWALWTISCRTKTEAPHLARACSTIWMARSTPAQKPRGAARSTFRAGRGRFGRGRGRIGQNSALLRVWLGTLRGLVFRGYHAPGKCRRHGCPPRGPASGCASEAFCACLPGPVGDAAGQLRRGRPVHPRMTARTWARARWRGCFTTPTGSLKSKARNGTRMSGLPAQSRVVRGFCRYIGTNPITMEVEIDFCVRSRTEGAGCEP